MTADTPLAFEVAELSAHPLAAPITAPRRNAFGTQTARHALFVKLRLGSGAVGWGEVFANWPAFAAPYRARIVNDVLAPLVTGQGFGSPKALWQDLTEATAQIAVQCGEPGPFAASLAGIEMASWSALAQQSATSLKGILGAQAQTETQRYASGIAPDAIERLVPRLVEEGWTAFKLKVGFGTDRDRAALKHLREIVGPEAIVMVDANMAWSPEAAPAAIDAISEFDLTWIEEPIRADCPTDVWGDLVKKSAVPLAVGENLRGLAAFSDAIEAGIEFIQPDPAKWGGLGKCIEVARMAAEADRSFAPHFLGGAVGFAATEALAHAGGAVYLECDASENPLQVSDNTNISIAVQSLLKDFPG